MRPKVSDRRNLFSAWRSSSTCGSTRGWRVEPRTWWRRSRPGWSRTSGFRTNATRSRKIFPEECSESSASLPHSLAARGEWQLFVQFYSLRKKQYFASGYFHEISMYQLVLVELSTSFFLGLLSFAKFRWTPVDRILYAQCTNWVILQQVRLNANLSTHCH